MKIFNKDISYHNLRESGALTFLSALLTVGIMALHVDYVPPFMILWFISWLLEKNYRKIRMYSRDSVKILFILFISYYLWQIISLVYSSDARMGLSNLFGRLSLLLFPLVLIYPGEMIRKRATLLTRVFAVSSFLFIVFCFFHAFYKSISINNGTWTFNPHPSNFFWENNFYSSYFVITQHPSYIATYVLLASFVCFEAFFDNSITLKKRISWAGMGSVLIMSQYFLSSRYGLLVCLILFPFYFIKKLKRIGIVRMIILVVIVILTLVPVILKNQRVDYFLGRILKDEAGYRKEDPRFQIWPTALNIAKEHPLFGVGIGDARNVMRDEFLKGGKYDLAKVRLNAHNQYLEVLVENGLIGLILFISISVYMGYICFMEKRLLYGLFIFLINVFFQFETVLYRFAGVSFFALFAFLLLYLENNKNEVVLE